MKKLTKRSAKAGYRFKKSISQKVNLPKLALHTIAIMCSAAGFVAVSAQAYMQAPGQTVLGPGGIQQSGGMQQPGGGNVSQLLSEINGNVLGISKTNSSLLEMRKESNPNPTGSPDLFDKTTTIAMPASLAPSRSYQINTPATMSLSYLGQVLNQGDNSQESSDSSSKFSYSTFITDTYCGVQVNSAKSNSAFIKYMMSASDIQYGIDNLPGFVNNGYCSSFLSKMQKNIQAYIAKSPVYQDSYSTNNHMTAEQQESIQLSSNWNRSYSMAMSQVFKDDGASQDNSYVDYGSNLLDGDSYSLNQLCTSWIQGAISTNTSVAELSKLNLAGSICEQVGSDNSGADTRAGSSAVVAGLLKDQLNDGYFSDLKNANLLQTQRVIAMNGIISNYLALQRSQQLQEVAKNTKALLLVQAAVLTNKDSN
jgi:hypothetical protein